MHGICVPKPSPRRYADTTARGGVLEAEGMVEIKYRTPELLATMHRIDPAILKLKVCPPPSPVCRLGPLSGRHVRNK